MVLAPTLNYPPVVTESARTMTAATVQEHQPHPRPSPASHLRQSSSSKPPTLSSSQPRRYPSISRRTNSTALLGVNGSPTMPPPQRPSGASAFADATAQPSPSNGHLPLGLQRSTSHDDSSARRPSSAPGNKQIPTIGFPAGEQSDSDRPKRPSVKPLLMRSKSEYGGSRQADEVDHSEEDIPHWGARHGFEEYHESPDVIAALANVSIPFSLLDPNHLHVFLFLHPKLCASPLGGLVAASPS